MNLQRLEVRHIIINLLSYDGIVQPLERVRRYRQFLAYLLLVFFNTLTRLNDVFKQFILRDNSLFYSRLSKLGNISNFSTFNSSDKNNPTLNPWFVTGFVDAEGSFSMSIFKSKTAAIGWTIEPCFIITLHKKDIELLNKIQSFFGVGTVSAVGNKVARYRVRSKNSLLVIISHFNKFPLQTSKINDLTCFCNILDLMNKKSHVNIEGFLNIASLINKLNNPLSQSLLDKLSSLGELPNTETQALALASKKSLLSENLDPWWISGFTTGEGSFTYFTRNRKKANGEIVKDYTLAYEVSQRSDSLYVLDLIAKYFKHGHVYSETRGVSKYRLVTRDQILNTLVPFFEKYPLEGNKNMQYELWVQIVKILQTTGRSEQREINVEGLIKKLSELNK